LKEFSSFFRKKRRSFCLEGEDIEGGTFFGGRAFPSKIRAAFQVWWKSLPLLFSGFSSGMAHLPFTTPSVFSFFYCEFGPSSKTALDEIAHPFFSKFRPRKLTALRRQRPFSVSKMFFFFSSFAFFFFSQAEFRLPNHLSNSRLSRYFCLFLTIF